MNIYEKLAGARVKLAEGGLKKGGTNDHTRRAYFELSDFLPGITKLGKELGFVCIPSFCTDLASLLIVNTEKTDEVIEITTPMSTADLKGVHAVQNLGAVQTYLRRYLYMAAFEIVEVDALEPTVGEPAKDKPAQAKPPVVKPIERPAVIDPAAKLTQAQRDYLVSLTFDDGKQNITKLGELKRINAVMGYSRTSETLQKDFNAIADQMEAETHE